ncbi:MAG: hypothetical protein AAF081_18385, partial [Actinomycetota bacterium]
MAEESSSFGSAAGAEGVGIGQEFFDLTGPPPGRDGDDFGAPDRAGALEVAIGELDSSAMPGSP